MKDSFATNAEILDWLALTVKRVRVYGLGEAKRAFLAERDYMRVGFDLFLVRMKDPLAWQAGTPESRFEQRVERMAFPPTEESAV